MILPTYGMSYMQHAFTFPQVHHLCTANVMLLTVTDLQIFRFASVKFKTMLDFLPLHIGLH